MSNSESIEQFVQHLTENQNRIYGYVYSLLGDHSRAADVVQETNLVLWRKVEEYQPDKPFLPWAFAIARFQVLAHLRDKKRDRFLLDADLVELLSSEAEQQAGRIDLLREALRACLQLLGPDPRDLIERRYFRETSIAAVAQELDRSVGSIKVALLRARRQLGECAKKRLSLEGEL